MRDKAIELAQKGVGPSEKLNLLREYVQAFVLRSLHESEAFTGLAFVGGTALRFLENLPRFSEDLDFSLIHKDGYEPKAWLQKAKRDLTASGFDCSITFNERKTVNTAWVRIGNLLAPSGVSSDKRRKLSIKLEIDTAPPEGATVKSTVLTRHLMFAIRHYDMPSLMAGKVHVLLTRPYPKGRDWYDLLWYRSRRPPVDPQMGLLQNALDQTGGKGKHRASHWRRMLQDSLKNIEIPKLRSDVAPFLENPDDRKLIREENLNRILG